jgi:multidrug efflux system membrane fusion protein
MRQFLWTYWKAIFALLALVIAANYLWAWAMGPSVTVTQARRGAAVEAVYATGTVEATVMLPIAPRITARLTDLMVDEGTNVTANQALAQLESADIQNSVVELDAKAAYAEGEYKRQEKLFAKGFSSTDARDQARANANAAKAAAARARAEADFTTLRAPADGLIIQRDGEIGQLIPVNQPVFWLSCCAPLRVSAEVDEEDIPRVKPGQKVLIRADAFPGQMFHGTVQSITPRGDAISRSYRVRIGFTQDVPLQIGMTAENNIVLRETSDALLIPLTAVAQNNVWVVRDGKLLRLPVQLGAQTEREAEIISGIEADDWIVIKPLTAMQAGQSVRLHKIANTEQAP